MTKRVILKPAPIAKDPRAKTRTMMMEEIDDDELEGLPSDEEMESEEKLADFQARFQGKDYTVRLERFNTDDNEWEWVVKLQMEGFEPFNILPKYGPGKYRAILFDGTSKYVKGGRMNFRFAAPLMKETEKPKSALEDPVVVMMLNQAKEQTVMMMEMFKVMAPSNAQPKSDMTQMIQAIAELNKMTPKQPDTAKTLLDNITMMEKMRGVFAPEEKESGGLMNELKEAIALLPALQAMKQGAPAPVQTPTGTRVIIPGATLTAPAPMARTLPIKERPAMNPTLAKALFYVPRFEEAAAANEPVEKWADYLMTVLDAELVPSLMKQYGGMASEDTIYEKLIEFGSKPEECEKIFVHAPALLPYKEWTLGVVAAALKQFEEEPAPTGE